MKEYDVQAPEIKAATGILAKLIIGSVAAVILLSLATDILVVVPAGYVGVDYSAWGGVNMQSTRSPGWSFKLPVVQKVFLVKTARDTVNLYPGGDDIAVSAPTKEGLIVTSDVTMLYRARASEAPRIIQDLTTDYRKGTVIPKIRSVVREVSGGMLVTEIYGPGREKLQMEILQKVTPLLEKDGFLVEEVLVREVKMPDQITRAIEDKQTMEQSALMKKYELDLAQKEAERLKLQGQGQANLQVAVAEGDAQSRIARAKGDAEAVVIAAKAEAEAKVIVSKGEADALSNVAYVMSSNQKAYDYKQLQVLEELYQNPNTRFIALPSDQMIYQLPQNVT